MIPKYIESFQKFCQTIGIDLSKWEMEDNRVALEYSDENECRELCYRELCYRSSTNGEYSIYAVLENFNPGEDWEIIEFSIAGD